MSNHPKQVQVEASGSDRVVIMVINCSDDNNYNNEHHDIDADNNSDAVRDEDRDDK